MLAVCTHTIMFMLTHDLEQELQDFLEHINISPLDTNKNIHLIDTASSTGCA